MRTTLSLLTITALCFAVAAAPAQTKKNAKNEWAKGVPFHTKFEDAIKEVRRTGKILVIYNGWKRRGI